VGGAPRSRRLAQLSAERGVANPWRPSMACLSGTWPLVGFLRSPWLFLRSYFPLVALTSLRLLAARAGDPRPGQIRRPRPNEL
jgi:hypothetical protein